MSGHDNGGPAFPNPALANEAFSPSCDLSGMSLRDYTAIKAMAALISARPAPSATDQDIAKAAWGMADAMLAERAKAEGQLCADRETLLALLAEAREWVEILGHYGFSGARATLSRIDDALAAEPEAKA